MEARSDGENIISAKSRQSGWLSERRAKTARIASQVHAPPYERINQDLIRLAVWRPAIHRIRDYDVRGYLRQRRKPKKKASSAVFPAHFAQAQNWLSQQKYGQLLNSLTGAITPQSNGSLRSNTVIRTLAVDGWAVTFGRARRGLGGLRPRPGPSSLHQMSSKLRIYFPSWRQFSSKLGTQLTENNTNGSVDDANCFLAVSDKGCL